MITIEASELFTIQTTKEGESGVEWDWTAVEQPGEENGFIRTCRFMENCDVFINGDGCPTCDFVRGVVQECVD